MRNRRLPIDVKLQIDLFDWINRRIMNTEYKIQELQDVVHAMKNQQKLLIQESFIPPVGGRREYLKAFTTMSEEDMEKELKMHYNHNGG